jgi:hypothetical protein
VNKEPTEKDKTSQGEKERGKEKGGGEEEEKGEEEEICICGGLWVCELMCLRSLHICLFAHECHV